MERETEQKTLLLEYIKGEIEHYKEPEKKGTPKGDPVGYSLEKYKFLLLSLTSLPIKDITELLNLSYGSTRLWRTEDQYWRKLESHARDFANRVVLYFDSFPKDKGPLPLAKEDIIKSYMEQHHALSDAAIYGKEVMRNIHTRAKKKSSSMSWEEGESFYRQIAKFFIVRKGVHTSLNRTERKKRQEPIENGETKNFTVFDFANAIARPWKPEKSMYSKAVENFTQQVKKII